MASAAPEPQVPKDTPDMAWLDALQTRPAAQHHTIEERPPIQPLQQAGLMTVTEVVSAVESGTEKRGRTWRIKERVEEVEKGIETWGR